MQIFGFEEMDIRDITVQSDTESFATNKSYDVSLTEEHYNIKLSSSKRKDERDKPLPELMRREVNYDSDILAESSKAEQAKSKIESTQKSLIFESVDEIIDNAAYNYPFDEEAAHDFVQVTTVDINDLKNREKESDLGFVLGECENSPIELSQNHLQKEKLQKGSESSATSFEKNQGKSDQMRERIPSPMMANKYHKDVNKGTFLKTTPSQEDQKALKSTITKGYHQSMDKKISKSVIPRETREDAHKKISVPELGHHVYEYFIPELFLEPSTNLMPTKQKQIKKNLQDREEKTRKTINDQYQKYESKDSHGKFNNRKLDNEKDGKAAEIKTDISGRVPIIVTPKDRNQKNIRKNERSTEGLKDAIFCGLSEQDRLGLWENLLDMGQRSRPSGNEFLGDEMTNQIVSNIYPLSGEFDYSRDKLRKVLSGYKSYDNELEVSPNMVFVAGVLCLMFDENFSLEAYKKLMFRKGLRRNFVPELRGVDFRLYQFEELLREMDPPISEFLRKNNVRPEDFASHWFGTMFAYRFPFEFTYRMYDWFIIDGFDAMLKMGLALVIENRQKILELRGKEEILSFLDTKLLQAHKEFDQWFLIADSIKIDDQRLRDFEERFYYDLYTKMLCINENVLSSSNETDKLLLIKFNELYELVKKVLQEKNEFLRKSLSKDVKIFIIEKFLCSVNK